MNLPPVSTLLDLSQFVSQNFSMAISLLLLQIRDIPKQMDKIFASRRWVRVSIEQQAADHHDPYFRLLRDWINKYNRINKISK